MKQKVSQSRESFVFYRSFYESIGMLPDDVQLVLYRAVVDYGLNQVAPDFNGVASPAQPFIEAIFAGIRPQLDANHKRFLNGCLGGCPTGTKKPSMLGNQNARKKQNQNKTKTKPNVNDNDNDNGNVEVADQELKIPFNDPVFIDTWNELKIQPKWKHKSFHALQMALNQLSVYPVRFAVHLMQNAIAGNYQGVVFDNTPERYKRWLQTSTEAGQDPQPGEVVTDISNIYR